jgi:EmrB/QacA subfamily drug resistance transporter
MTATATARTAHTYGIALRSFISGHSPAPEHELQPGAFTDTVIARGLGLFDRVRPSKVDKPAVEKSARFRDRNIDQPFLVYAQASVPDSSLNATLSVEDPASCHVSPPVPKKAEVRIVLVIALLAGFITPFDGSAVNIALPLIGAEYHMDAVALSWISTAYLLATAVFIVPFGRLADIHGRKKVFLAGISVFTIASLLQVVAPSTAAMIAVRVLQGFGSALIFGTAIAILSSVVPREERGRALGLYITAVYLGLTAGPFLGGLLTASLGWRAIFLINVPIGAAAVLLVVARLRGEWAECRGERFDIAGSVLYGLGLVAVMFGLSVMPSAVATGAIVVGLAVLSVFVWLEFRTVQPVLSMGLFVGNRGFLFSNLAALINYSATSAVTFLMSLYFQYARDLPPEIAGIVMVPQFLLQMAVSPFAGRLSDRTEPRVIASVGMGITALGLGLLTVISETTPFAFVIGCLALLGLGFGLFSSPNTNAIMSSVDRRHYGVASGMNGTMRLLGQMFSMGVVMTIFSVVIGRIEITPEYYGVFIDSARYALIVFTVLCLAGMGASLARGRSG